MRKSLFILAAMCCAMAANAAVYSGTCGTSVNWAYNTTKKILSISGTGEMTNFTDTAGENSAPWLQYKDSILVVQIGNGVTTIGDYAFMGCRRLTAFSASGSTLTSIGKFAFGKCTNLQSIAVPAGVTSLGGYAFYGCTTLKDISLPSTLTTIYGGAFGNCTSLESIVIPEGVTTIGNGELFWSCPSLTTISIPNSLTEIGERAFVACFAVTHPLYNSTIFMQLPEGYINNHLHQGYRIPDGITTIANYCLYNTHNLGWIEIPASVTKIDRYAFYMCDSSTIFFMDGATPPTLGNMALKNPVDGEIVPLGSTIFVPTEEALTAYKKAWGSGYKFVVGNMATHIKTFHPTMTMTNRHTDDQRKYMHHGADHYVFFSADPATADTLDLEAKYVVNKQANAFWSDSIYVTPYIRAVSSRDGNYGAWAKLSKYQVCNNNKVYVVPPTTAKADRIQYKLEFDYILPQGDSYTHNIIYTDSVEAMVEYPMTFAKVDGADWSYRMWEKNPVSYDTYGYPRNVGDTFYFRGGDTLWLASDTTDAVQCRKRPVNIADISRKFTIEVQDTVLITKDSIMTPTDDPSLGDSLQIVCSRANGLYLTRFVTRTGMFEVNGEVADTITYVFYSTRYGTDEPLAVVKAPCGEAPEMPNVKIKAGYHFVAWHKIAYMTEETFTGAIPAMKADAFFWLETAYGEAIDNVTATDAANKIIENGNLYIIRNGVRYNAQGAVVE